MQFLRKVNNSNVIRIIHKNDLLMYIILADAKIYNNKNDSLIIIVKFTYTIVDSLST